MLPRLCVASAIFFCSSLATTTTQAVCATPSDSHGSYTRSTNRGPNAVWILSCDRGFGLSIPKDTVMKECDGTGNFLQPGASACTPLPGCLDTEYVSLFGEDQTKPTNCFQSGNLMEEGASCEAVCQEDAIVVGVRLCASGVMIGDTGCLYGDAKQSLRVSDATAVSAQYDMNLEGCNEGIAASSCAQLLKKIVQEVVDARVTRVSVFDGTGRCISSTSNRTYEASNPSNTRRILARTGRHLAGTAFTVHVDIALLPADITTLVEVIQRVQALGETGNVYYNELETNLASQTPPIVVVSSVVSIGAQPFSTTVAASPLLGGIVSLQDLPAPIFPSTTVAPEPDLGIGLPLAIAIIFGVIIGLSCCTFICYKYCKMRRALFES